MTRHYDQITFARMKCSSIEIHAHIYQGKKAWRLLGLYKVSLESNEILQVAHIFATADAADGFNYGSKTSLSFPQAAKSDRAKTAKT